MTYTLTLNAHEASVLTDTLNWLVSQKIDALTEDEESSQDAIGSIFEKVSQWWGVQS